jgi:hypothetical protein
MRNQSIPKEYADDEGWKKVKKKSCIFYRLPAEIFPGR